MQELNFIVKKFDFKFFDFSWYSQISCVNPATQISTSFNRFEIRSLTAEQTDIWAISRSKNILSSKIQRSYDKHLKGPIRTESS